MFDRLKQAAAFLTASLEDLESLSSTLRKRDILTFCHHPARIKNISLFRSLTALEKEMGSIFILPFLHVETKKPELSPYCSKR